MPILELLSRPHWPIRPPEDWPHASSGFVWRGFGLSFRYVSGSGPLPWDHPRHTDAEQSAHQGALATGWPWRAMRSTNGERSIDPLSPNPRMKVVIGQFWDRSPDSVFRRGVPLATGPSPAFMFYLSPRHLPLEPLPLGFALDTLLNLIIFLPLAMAAGAIRRTWRLHHRRCPRCNYDLSTDPPPDRCPECGHAPRRRQDPRLREASASASDRSGSQSSSPGP
jgi:hypothetical protein